jgi:hypothetical protein
LDQAPPQLRCCYLFTIRPFMVCQVWYLHLLRPAGCVGSICCLYRNAYVIAQELGREVGPIRPGERVKLRMNLELPEYDRIAQRFEDGAAENRRQIDFAARAVAKPEPHHVAGHIARLDDVTIHFGTPPE